MGPVLKIAIFFLDFLITLTRRLSWSCSSSAAAVEAGAACTGECELAAAETMVTGVVGAAPLARRSVGREVWALIICSSSIYTGGYIFVCTLRFYGTKSLHSLCIFFRFSYTG